jgi:hypothetical protein
MMRSIAFLALRMEAVKAPMDAVVIVHAERASEN